jgi:hypothetical protein
MIFFAKKICENIGVFAQTTASFCKNLIITLIFEKSANCFAEDWEKSQKIVIITSTPGVNFLSGLALHNLQAKRDRSNIKLQFWFSDFLGT